MSNENDIDNDKANNFWHYLIIYNSKSFYWPISERIFNLTHISSTSHMSFFLLLLFLFFYPSTQHMFVLSTIYVFGRKVDKCIHTLYLRFLMQNTFNIPSLKPWSPTRHSWFLWDNPPAKEKKGGFRKDRTLKPRHHGMGTKNGGNLSNLGLWAQQ